MAPGWPGGAGARRGAGGTETPRRAGSPGGGAAGELGPRSRSPPRSSCSRRRRGARRKRRRRRKGTARRSPSPYRVVYPPHQDAEQRIAGPKELHFLRYEVLLLGLRLARQDGRPQVAGGRHGRRLSPPPPRSRGRGPALSTRRPGEAAASPRRQPRRAVPSSDPRRARPRSAPLGPLRPAGWQGREAALGSRPGRIPRLRGSALSPRLDRAAASGFRVGRRRHDAGGGRAAAAPPGGARGAAAAAGPLSCALALRLPRGLRGGPAAPCVRGRAPAVRSRPAEDAREAAPPAPQEEKREGWGEWGDRRRGAACPAKVRRPEMPHGDRGFPGTEGRDLGASLAAPRSGAEMNSLIPLCL